MQLKERLSQIAQERFGLTLEQCDRRQLYEALLILTRTLAQDRPAPAGGRKLYYFSAEFLMGKLLSNNLLALGIYGQVKELLSGLGRELCDIESLESFEPEPSLGNGGLGRLAACFLDSIAALGLPGDGVGLNYHYGLFRQKFRDGRQIEAADPWIEEESWLIPTGKTFPVSFGGFCLNAVLYDIAIPGAGNDTANRLHLFDVERPAPPPVAGIRFDKGDIAGHLTSFLYPDDSDESGRLLRVYQQYFMVSAGAQLILEELEARGFALDTLSEHVVIQINDTHPSMVIPELIRLLTDRGLTFDQALEQVRHTCAYTNHTILAEALEKWPLAFLKKAAPQLVPVIQELDRRMGDDPKTAIIDDQDRVHMAHMDIHCGFSVNGVAALHTEILKNSELKPFYDLYPEKFNNKTNGVTFRRWLEACNPGLAGLLDECVGTGWRRDARELEKLAAFAEDEGVRSRLLEVKMASKQRLCQALAEEQGVKLDPESVFDIQVKRLHEYKRQQMNALYLIGRYLEIKAGRLPERPITAIFGAKAAPAYVTAKQIIHLILCLQKLIEGDPQVRPWLRVIMVENYNVTWAERLIPACDISEQISLASKEASGTSNMKFMANGAVTLGTQDGANVEIAQLVGPENIYTFGRHSDEVIRLYQGDEPDGRSYRPLDFYHRPAVERLVDFLVSPEMLSTGSPADLATLWKDMKSKDWFMALLDLEDYIAVKDRCLEDYEDRPAWAGKMLANIAKSGYFSSDRTIRQYNQDIWRLRA